MHDDTMACDFTDVVLLATLDDLVGCAEELQTPKQVEVCQVSFPALHDGDIAGDTCLLQELRVSTLQHLAQHNKVLTVAAVQ